MNNKKTNSIDDDDDDERERERERAREADVNIARRLKLTSAMLLLYACRVDFSKSRDLEASETLELDISSETIASCNLSRIKQYSIQTEGGRYAYNAIRQETTFQLYTS